MNKKTWTTWMVAATMATLGQQAQANLVQDGSFESVSLASGTYTQLWNGQSAAWALGASGLEVRNNIVGAAYEGNNYAELDAYGANSFISQVLSTVAGQWYELSFAYANRLGWPVASNGLTWEVGGHQGTAPALAFNNTGTHDWHLFSVVWQATSDTTVLKISAAGLSDGAGSSLDAISVTPVPEPQSAWLMLAGLLGMGAWVSRRKQAQR